MATPVLLTSTLITATARTAASTIVGGVALLAVLGSTAGTPGATAATGEARGVALASFVTAGPVAPGCRPGYVHRDAFDGDRTCVTPFERDLAHRWTVRWPGRPDFPGATPPAGRPSPAPGRPPAPSDTSHGSLLSEVRRELGGMRQSRYQHTTD